MVFLGVLSTLASIIFIDGNIARNNKIRLQLSNLQEFFFLAAPLCFFQLLRFAIFYDDKLKATRLLFNKKSRTSIIDTIREYNTIIWLENKVRTMQSNQDAFNNVIDKMVSATADINHHTRLLAYKQFMENHNRPKLNMIRETPTRDLRDALVDVWQLQVEKNPRLADPLAIRDLLGLEQTLKYDLLNRELLGFTLVQRMGSGEIAEFSMALNMHKVSRETHVTRSRPISNWDISGETAQFVKYSGLTYAAFNETADFAKGIAEHAQRMLSIRCDQQNNIDPDLT